VKKILVVDDEPQIRRALGLDLTARDYQVLFADTGESAMQAAATGHRSTTTTRSVLHRLRVAAGIDTFAFDVTFMT
jgi:DNA-binding response OmpR family regulator